MQGGLPPCTSTTKLSRGVVHQRGHARHAAHGLALSRCGPAYQAPPLDFCWQAVVSVSGESGVPLSPGSTMPRLAGASPPAASLRGMNAHKWQRGHLGPPVAALVGNPISPLYFVRCSVVSVSGHGGVPPCPGSTRLSRGARGSCGSRPLRQYYITPHCPQCPPVATLKLRLVPVTASRPSGEGNRRYAKLPSLGTVAQPSALPGRVRALRAAVWLPCRLS